MIYKMDREDHGDQTEEIKFEDTVYVDEIPCFQLNQIKLLLPF
jgi:hypothetical protein